MSLLQGRVPATCVDNVTESGREVKGYVCQSTVFPSDIRSQSVVSSQPFLTGDTLMGMDRMLLPNIAINESLMFVRFFSTPDLVICGKVC